MSGPPTRPLRLPRTVEVGYRRYTITRDAREVPGAAGDQHGYAGRTLHADSVLYIDPELAYGEVRATLLHELLHACVASAGVADTLRAHVKLEDVDPEEIYVDAFANTLLAVLDRNPKVRGFLWPS
jgi:hypothetical protein